MPHIVFGQLLKHYRLAAGLSQEALAERAGVSARAIAYLERGLRAPFPDTVRRLAGALALTPERQADLAAAMLPLEAAPSDADPAPRRRETKAPLVGRTEQLAALERHLAGEGPPLLLLAGEPGIGKSRLLLEAARLGDAAGWRVLEGGCQRRGSQEPYAPLLGALQRDIRNRQPAGLRHALRGCAWLVRLLPELADGPIEPLPAWSMPFEQERRLMGEAMARYLTNVAGPSGTLLLLDDLQWAGQDALDLLATLVRDAGEMPVRLVGAYRDTEVRPRDPLAVLRADLAAAGLAAQHPLAPLAPRDAAHLLEGILAELGRPERVSREHMVQRTGGVPFFVMSYAQTLAAGGDAGRAEEGVPWNVGQSIRQRVAILEEPAQEVLAMAAVLGREVDPAVLLAMDEHGERATLRALDAACHARLLVGERDRYRFTHDLIREVVEADLGAARRTVLHRRIAEVLEQRPGDPQLERLAYHYSRGGVPDRAASYGERAGDRALAQYAHAAAESFFAAAAKDWERLGKPLDAARVQAKAAEPLRLMGRYEAAQAALERAAEAYRAGGDRAKLIEIVAEIGRNLHYRGRNEEGLRWLEPQVAALEAATTAEVPGHILSPLYQALGIMYGCVGRVDEFMAMTARSVELIRQGGTGSALATALYRHGFALMDSVGRIEEMRSLAMEAAAVAEAAGDLNAMHWTLHQVAFVHRIKGEWEPCVAYADRAIAAAERRGDPGPLIDLVRERGLVAFYMGAWDQARRHFERAQAFGHMIGTEYPYGEWSARLALARLALAQGEWESATRASVEVLALAQEFGLVYEQRESQELMAELDLRAGRARQALSRLDPIRDHPGVEERIVTPLRVLLAWAHLELGMHETAQEVIEDAVRRLRADEDRLGLVDALRVQALVQIGRGRIMEAVASLQEGLALTGAMPYPYAEARLRHAYGALLIRMGERMAASEQLAAALATFRRLGARKDAEETERLLGTLG